VNMHSCSTCGSSRSSAVSVGARWELLRARRHRLLLHLVSRKPSEMTRFTHLLVAPCRPALAALLAAVLVAATAPCRSVGAHVPQTEHFHAIFAGPALDVQAPKGAESGVSTAAGQLSNDASQAATRWRAARAAAAVGGNNGSLCGVPLTGDSPQPAAGDESAPKAAAPRPRRRPSKPAAAASPPPRAPLQRDSRAASAPAEEPQVPYLERGVWQDLRLLFSFTMGIACVQLVESLRADPEGETSSGVQRTKFEMYPYAL